MALGAFNDNVSKMIVVLFATMILGQNSDKAHLFVPAVSACFILPYLLFSSASGYLADRFSKKTIMVWAKFAEVLIMCAGFLILWLGEWKLLLLVMFLMGTQSAFFSPAKYGFLPETTEGTRLMKANGMTQFFTFLATIGGGWFGGEICALTDGDYARAFSICIAIAILGLIASCFITTTKPGRTDIIFKWRNTLTHYVGTLREMKSQPRLLLSVFVCTYFWFEGVVAQLALIFLIKDVLAGSDRVVGITQGAMGIGIGVGSLLTGFLFRGKIPYRLVAPAMAASGLCIAGLGSGITSLPLICLTIMLAGMTAGSYQLSSNTTIQKLSPIDSIGRYISACNAIDSISMLLASVVVAILMGSLHFSPGALFVSLGILNMAFAIFVQYLTRKLPAMAEA